MALLDDILMKVFLHQPEFFLVDLSPGITLLQNHFTPALSP